MQIETAVHFSLVFLSNILRLPVCLNELRNVKLSSIYDNKNNCSNLMKVAVIAYKLLYINHSFAQPTSQLPKLPNHRWS